MDLSRRQTFDDAVEFDDAGLDQLLQSTEDDLDEQYDVQDTENLQVREMWDLIMGEMKTMRQSSEAPKEWENLALKMRNDESYKTALKGTFNGAGFLHYLVKDIEVARRCTREVATIIIDHNPDSVEQVIDGDEHPLTIAIKASCDGLFISMLTSLDQRPIYLLKNEKGEGRRCIKAAFDALRQRGHSSITIAAYKLAGWASDSMLSGLRTDSNLTPLQIAVTADQSYINGDTQLKLVKLLLKRHEPSIHELVFRGSYQILWGKIFLQDEITVYEWHQRTLDLFKKAQQTPQQPSSLNLDRDRQGIAPSQKHGQKINKGSASGIFPVNGNRGKPNQNNQPGSSAPYPIMTIGSNMERNEISHSNVPSLAKQPGSSETSDGKLPVSRQLPIRAKQKKLQVHQARNNPNVEETSKRIKIELQEHYLRSTILTPPGEDNTAISEIDETEIKQFFGNDMQKIGLDLGNQPHGEPLTEAGIRKFFQDTKFNSVLAYVSLPQAPIKLAVQQHKKFQAPRYSDDRLFYFEWLHNEKKVDKILKLIVNDTKQPHRDEVIEEAVGGKSGSKDGLKHDFKVEILKWRKVDLDPTTIGAGAPGVRELHLDWSGSNVALLGWSALDGLPALKHLRQIHLTYSMYGESHQRTSRNIELFKSRLNSCREDQNNQVGGHGYTNGSANAQGRREYPAIEVIEHRARGGSAGAPPSTSTGRRQEPKHKWINSMRRFVAFVPELPEDMDDLDLSSKLTSRRVTVALIDDGVDVFTSELARFSDRFFPGVSFDRSNDRHSSREWSSRGGHGTLMAKLILAVCPHADIVTYRVLMRPDHETNMLIPDAESAAKAIKHAVKRDVDIISMSWTISKPGEGSDKSGYERLKNVMAETASERGNALVPLLFCAAADDGLSSSNNDEELPSAMAYSKLICIGAATSTGQTSPQVSAPGSRQYFFPGVDVPDLRENFQYNHDSPDTDPFVNSGSSIACALAVGQAALILHCVKLSVYYTKKKEQMRGVRQVEIITEDDLERMKEFEYMKKGFDALCSENLSKHKVSFPTQGFEKATDQMQKLADQGKLNSLEGFEPIVRLVRGLIGIVSGMAQLNGTLGVMQDGSAARGSCWNKTNIQVENKES
ncbi:Major intracellular serine protease [Fusarium austroafricanum]|uniref:Major intracellular serine protease n=1 Tax=Fusarium austroafricanum TaxID=2364996 RepID=A0A8H4P603_9HYPO|nr:Major intracellular serine protease [Fusarium austroafricanum]